MAHRYEVVIVGGGIVGLATALALTRRRATSVLVLEAEGQLASHQSGHNSGVIHAGLYYKPGSLKARTCMEGRQALYRFCEMENVPFVQSGKLVVALSESELPALAELERRGTANGLRRLKRVSAAEMREIEPHVHGVEGLWVGDTGVVDFRAVAEAIARRVQQDGGEIRTCSRVTRISRSEGTSHIECGHDSVVSARVWVNCAGLQADRVARTAGVTPGVHIIPFRGEYWEMRVARRHLVRSLIYPVPNPDLPFLGVHFTRGLDGHVEVGPNAVLALKREGYQRGSLSMYDVADMLAFPGFWRMAKRFCRTGMEELGRSWSRRKFLEAARRLLPELHTDDIEPGRTGVRAQAVDRQGRLLDDFCLVESAGSVHVLNAPSPAATGALAIGQLVADKALEQLV